MYQIEFFFYLIFEKLYIFHYVHIISKQHYLCIKIQHDCHKIGKKDDVICIDKNTNSVHVFGEVSKPGMYYPDMNYSLTELVSAVGINQLTANAKKVYVIREKFDTFLAIDIFQLDIRNPVNFISLAIPQPIKRLIDIFSLI